LLLLYTGKELQTPFKQQPLNKLGRYMTSQNICGAVNDALVGYIIAAVMKKESESSVLGLEKKLQECKKEIQSLQDEMKSKESENEMHKMQNEFEIQALLEAIKFYEETNHRMMKENTEERLKMAKLHREYAELRAKMT
jgi:mannitol-specific phosphotransferase system IIBC component